VSANAIRDEYFATLDHIELVFPELLEKISAQFARHIARDASAFR
jgi:hypothetical protein